MTPKPTRGPKSGTGSAQMRILDVLRRLGTELDGRPCSLRSAELADRARVNHHSLSKCVRSMVESGLITRCLVQPAIGNKTHEYRIGPGQPMDMRPLDVKRAGVATGNHRSAGPQKPLPKTRHPEVVQKTTRPVETDADFLARLQAMSADEFAGYVGHLARVWSYGRRGGANMEVRGDEQGA